MEMGDQWINDFFEKGTIFGKTGFTGFGSLPRCVPCAHFFHKVWQTMKLINSETPRTPVLASFIFMVSLYYYAFYDANNIVVLKFKSMRRRLRSNILGLVLGCLLRIAEMLFIIIFPLFSYYTTWIPANKAAYYVADHTNSEFWLKTVALLVSVSTMFMVRRSIRAQQKSFKFDDDHYSSSNVKLSRRSRGNWYSRSRR